MEEIGKCLPPEVLNSIQKQNSLLPAAEFMERNGVRAIPDPGHCQKLADKHFLLCCFSKCDLAPDSEILLWSHYAKHHQGVRIEFELDPQNLPLFEIDYSKHRCSIDTSKIISETDNYEVCQKLLRTKSLAWKYENEVRLILFKRYASRKPDAPDNRYYFPFEPGWVKSVDFGIKCPPETVNAIESIIKSDFPHAAMRKADYHQDDFAIAYKSIG